MPFSTFSRVVHLGRTRRWRPAREIAEPATQAERQRLQWQPSMAGLNVSPVHGRHCICERCERLRDQG